MEIRKDFEARFKMFGGGNIYNISNYLLDYIERDPGVTLAIGNDSVQRRRRTIYANTIMLYNKDIRNGAHVVFYRESVPKIYDTHTRLYKEAEMMYELGMYLDYELKKNLYERKDLNEYDHKKYKFMLNKEKGMYKNLDLSGHKEPKFIEKIHLTNEDLSKQYRLVDIHLDLNPNPGGGQNKSYQVYRSAIPWLRGSGFRVFAKPFAHAATSAADLLLK